MDFRNSLRRIRRVAGAEAVPVSANEPALPNAPGEIRNSSKGALRNAWRLAQPYWGTQDSRKSWPLAGGVVSLGAVKVGLAALNLMWWAGFIDAAIQKNTSQIPVYLGMYAALTLAESRVEGWYFGCRQRLKMQWRLHMHEQWTKKWCNDDHAYYHMLSSHEKIDNPDHRLTEDIKWWVDDTVEMGNNALNQAIQLGTFTGMLWGLSGVWNATITGQNLEIHGGLVWVSLLTSLAGAWYAYKKGSPLTEMYNTERDFEGQQRTQLVRIKENAESIASIGGAKVERGVVNEAVDNIAKTWNKIVDRQVGLVSFTVANDRLSKLVPYVALLAGYFAGDMTWGKVMQGAFASEKVQSAFNWPLSVFPQFFRWKTFTQRITELGDAIDDVRRHDQSDTLIVTRDEQGRTVTLTDVTINRPKGEGTLLSDISMNLQPGDRFIMMGPSGAGKTTYLRTVVGLHRAAMGRIDLPKNTLFIPQKLYLPNISLRGILSYPDEAGTFSSEQMADALLGAGLPRLIPFLEQEHLRGDDFSSLSGGEQQRLRLATILLHQPSLLLIDEGTSALDKESGQYFYGMLVKMLEEKLPDAMIVSVAHHENLIPFHTHHGVIQDKALKIRPVPAQGFDIN